MNTQYTPGPWEVGYASPENRETSTLAVWKKEVLDAGFGSVVCKISPEKTMDETDKANAHLIAAAPELLEALIKSIRVIKQWHGADVFDIYYNNAPEMKPIREAIAKAKGGAK